MPGSAVAPPAAAEAGGSLPAGRAAALQAALDVVHAAGMPGLFAEVREGNWVWPGTSGVADIGTGAPMRPWSVHRIGSLTKTFVATTTLQLVGEGRRELDEPIGRYVADVVPADLVGQAR